MPKYQATSYIRLSYTDDRSSESDSVTNQRKLIENFIKRNPDIEIISEKIDDGYSGIIFDRPAFKEMMQDITDGKINCVIVKDLSRLGREYIETGRYLRRVFPAYGVRFIAITDNIDTAHENSGDDLTVSVKNIMNEAYCRDISIKTRTSLDIKRRNGDFVGAFPVYGYMKSEENKNLLVPDPYAARVVQDIFRMRLDGTSALRIATTLNDMGVLSPLAYKKNNGFPYAKHGYTDKEDCKWSATTVIRILQDETYTGTLVQGKQGTPHYKIKQMEQRPSSEWIRVPDAHEALIPKQDFELVQRIRRLDTRTSPKKDTVYLFSGILICGCCGARMTRKTNRVKDLLGGVVDLVVKLLSSNPGAASSLLSLAGVNPSYILGCTVDAPLTVNGTDYVGGVTGRGDGVYIAPSSADYLSKVSYWRNSNQLYGIRCQASQCAAQCRWLCRSDEDRRRSRTRHSQHCITRNCL